MISSQAVLELIGDQRRPNGLRRTSVSANPSDPSQAFAAVARAERRDYEQDYVPVENDAIASLDDMSIIEDARGQVADNTSLARSRQRAERDRKRYGLRATAAQLEAADNSLKLNKATGDASTLNEARLNQFDRNRGFRNELINIGRGLNTAAQEGLGEAAGLQTTREANNRSAKAAADAQNTQMMGTLAATALMAFMV